MSSDRTSIQVPPAVEKRIQELTEDLASALGETPEVSRRTVELAILTRGIQAVSETVSKLAPREQGRSTG